MMGVAAKDTFYQGLLYSGVELIDNGSLGFYFLLLNHRFRKLVRSVYIAHTFHFLPQGIGRIKKPVTDDTTGLAVKDKFLQLLHISVLSDYLVATTAVRALFTCT